MRGNGIYLLILLFGLLLVVINCFMTRDIWSWVLSLKKRIFLTVLVWFVPVIGLVIADKSANLGWFKKGKKSEGGSAIATGLLGMESIFNPGMRYRMEIVEKRKSEVLRKDRRGEKKEDENDDESEK